MTRTAGSAPHLAAALVAALVAHTGCATKNLAIEASKALFPDLLTAYRRESDLVLVKQSAPSHLKMLDGLLVARPDDRELQATACQLYAWYAFGILEDEYEAAAPGAEQDAAKARVKEAYRRAREWGLMRLSLWKGGPMRPPSQALPDAGEVSIYAKSYTRSDVPALFWTAFSWMALTQLSLESTRAIAELPGAKAIADIALALDPAYHHGGPHLLAGVYLGSRSRALGGDPDAAAKHFDEADRIAGARFLFTPLLKARFWAVTAQDRPAYESLLRRVSANDPSILPEERLANELARRRAPRYLARADELF